MALLPDQLRHLAAKVPDEVGYTIVPGSEQDGLRGEVAMTFREWDETASRFARGLHERGVVPGDRVALVFDTSDALHHLQAYVGVHKAGAVNVPVNTKMSAPEMAAVLRHAEPRVAVASARYVDDLRKLATELDELDIVVAVGEAEAEAWDDVLHDDASDFQADITDDDMADIVYTSGTTGRPKGVVTRHRNAAYVPVGEPQWNGGTWFHASPLFTIAGITFVYVPMSLGMSGMYMPRFDAEAFLGIAEDHRIQMAFLVPAMVELLLARDDIEERDLSSIQMASVGSAPIATSALLRFHNLLPNGSALNSFALTESGPAYIILSAEEVERRPGSVGRPVAPLEVRIVDDDDDALPPGEVGEVLLRSPGKEREYFRDPEATAVTWQGGWLRTGDLGRLDEDGYLYIVGRKKDMIIRGGHNIHAADVEEVIYDHPDVAEVAVVGIPHDVLGEDVAAVVVPKKPDLDVDELHRWCEGRLARYAVPRTIEFRDELPRNAFGKVMKSGLAAELARGGQEG